MKIIRAFLTLGLGLGDILGGLTSIIGIGSGVKNLVGGNQGGSKNSNTYVPTGLGDADQTFQQVLQALAGNISDASGQINPVLAQAFQSLLGAPIAQQYGQLATQAGGAGDFLTGMGRDLGAAGQQFWQTSLDPQNALRDRLQQRVTDASRAGTSARGIGMGGEAAGIENQAVTDFLLNWENNQLARQATGLQGYTGAANQAGRETAGGLAASGLVPQYTASGASWPMQAAGLYAGAMQPWNQQLGGILQSIIPYLNQGLGATGQAFDQGQTGLANMTYGAGKIGDAFGKIFGGSPSYTGMDSGFGYEPWYGLDTQGGGR